MTLCYTHVHPLPWASVRGYRPKLCCLDPWAQCHVPVQKLDSWTKIVLAEQICADLSKAFWCEHMSLVHSEAQWMKCNPRNTHDVPNPTADLLFVKGQVPHITFSCPISLSVELELHLPVTVKPWKSTEELQVFQGDCVTSQIDLNRLGNVVQKRHLVWETRSCHPQLLLLWCPLSLPPGADLCMQWHFHGWGVASSPPQRVWGLFLLCAFLCVIHVAAVSLPPCFSAPDVISSLLLLLASHGKYTELLHVRNTLSEGRVFLLINGTKALALGGDKAENKLLQVCLRETRGLTSSPCQWWNSRLKWQQGCTLGTF